MKIDEMKIDEMKTDLEMVANLNSKFNSFFITFTDLAHLASLYFALDGHSNDCL